MNGIDGMTRESYVSAFMAGSAGGSGRTGSTAHTPEEREFLRQMADPNSDFYAQMRLAILMKGRKQKEDEEEQDKIEAMLLLLDAMNGRLDKEELLRIGGKGQDLPWSVRMLLLGLEDKEAASAERDEDRDFSEDGQISGNGPDDLRISSFYGTIYGGGPAPLSGEAAGAQPDLAGREALWWAGRERP